MTATEAAVTERPSRFVPPSVVRLSRSWIPKPRTTGEAAREPLPLWTVTAIWVLAAFCALALWFLFYALVLSGLQANRSQHVQYAEFREQLALATAPIGGTIAPGTPVALIEAPSIGLNEIVVEGTTSRSLTLGPGHLSDTPLPGQAGVSVLLGRSVTFGAPFGQITQLKPGATITVTTGQGVFHYTVDRVRYPGDPVPVPPAAGKGRLTLMTSYASGWRSGWAPDETVLVDSTLHGAAQPTPPGMPSAVVQAAEPMQGDPSALFPLVLWLQAFVIVVLAVLWARIRWGGWKTWLVGMPLVLAVLWGTTQTVSLLMPNLI